MALKLIREAHLRTTLSADDIKALSIIKEATGKDSIAAVLAEAFVPSADDFDAWMRVVVGEAQDRGINLNKKAEFMQLVMDVLENDPASPAQDMQEAIAQKLWQDYKAAKNEVRINKIAAAREEEEKVDAARKQIADRHAQGPMSIQPQSAEDEESAFIQAFNAAKGVEDEEVGEDWYDQNGRPNPNGAYDADGNYYRERDNSFEDEEDGMSFLKDVLSNTSSGPISKGSFSSHLRADDEDLEDGDATFNPDEYSVDDDEVFTSDDECECPCQDDEADEDSQAADDMGPPDEELDDDTMDDIDADVSREAPDKSYDEEEAVKSFFRQAATAPRTMMSQAIKDIENEGKSAWRNTTVPKNPHPQKSAAYRAWQKGMLASAKEALGIVDKPKDPKVKPKKKK